jgi:hypothetical protein
MRRSSAALTLVAALVLMGCQQAEQKAGGLPESSTVPLVPPHYGYAPERDDPRALVKTLLRRQREGLALLTKAHRERADAAGGCVHARPTVRGSTPPKEWLPRPPKFSARLLGRQVEVEVELQGNATSLACRPGGLAVVVSSDTADINGISEYQLFGPGVPTAPRRFRVLGQIPFDGTPPYRLSVNVANVLGRRSPYVEMALDCPADGCVPGPTFTAHAVEMGPTLPLRGITMGALERSVQAAFAFDPNDLKIGAATCRAAVCSVPFSDPLRGARGIARYRAQGETVAGCWLATNEGSNVTPATAESPMPRSLGGCVAWQ